MKAIWLMGYPGGVWMNKVQYNVLVTLLRAFKCTVSCSVSLDHTLNVPSCEQVAREWLFANDTMPVT